MMSPYDWKVDAAQARADRDTAHDADNNPECARCGDVAWIASPELAVDLCLTCHDAFIAWDRANPTAPYDLFMPEAFVDVPADTDDEVPAGYAFVGLAPVALVFAVAAVAFTIGLTAEPGTFLHVFGGPLAVVLGGYAAARLILWGEPR